MHKPLDCAFTLIEALDVKSQVAARVRASIDIFLLLVREEAPRPFPNGLDFAPAFFFHTIEAHLAHIVVGLGRFFDTDARSMSLPNLRSWATAERLNAELIRSSKHHLKAVSKPVRALMLLRNEVYAHRSLGRTYKETFVAADLKYESLREISDAILASLNDLRSAAGVSALVYPTRPTRQLTTMFARLRSTLDKGPFY